MVLQHHSPQPTFPTLTGKLFGSLLWSSIPTSSTATRTGHGPAEITNRLPHRSRKLRLRGTLTRKHAVGNHTLRGLLDPPTLRLRIELLAEGVLVIIRSGSEILLHTKTLKLGRRHGADHRGVLVVFVGRGTDRVFGHI